MLKRYDKDSNGYLTENEFVDSLADPTLLALESFSVFRVGNFHLATNTKNKWFVNWSFKSPFLKYYFLSIITIVLINAYFKMLTI